MYQDQRPCQVCGSPVRLVPADGSAEDRRAREADDTVDDRVCTNPDCEGYRPQ